MPELAQPLNAETTLHPGFRDQRFKPFQQGDLSLLVIEDDSCPPHSALLLVFSTLRTEVNVFLQRSRVLRSIVNGRTTQEAKRTERTGFLKGLMEAREKS
jgi:hypothetical protein